MDRTALFVYGTLKRGFCRESALVDQQFVGDVQTAPEYRLINLGSYPGLIRDAAGGTSIEGELWLVTVECLHRLDRIEGVHEGLYARDTVTLEPAPAYTVETYIYQKSVVGYPECGRTWE